jgi:hypothetical protein
MVQTRGMDGAGTSNQRAGTPPPADIGRSYRGHACVARPDGRKVVLQNLKIVLIQTSWRRIRQYSMSPPNHWMLIHRFTMMEAKFELLRCTKYQKTQFVAQQLQDFANNWWANYTTTVAHDHEVTYGMSSRTPFVPIMSKKGS